MRRRTENKDYTRTLYTMRTTCTCTVHVVYMYMYTHTVTTHTCEE